MSNFIEYHLEQAVMEWFQDLGYQTIYGPDISPGGSFQNGRVLEMLSCMIVCTCPQES